MNNLLLALNICSFFLAIPTVLIALANISRKTKTKIALLSIETQLVDCLFLLYMAVEGVKLYDFVFPSYLAVKLSLKSITNYQIQRFNKDILRIIRAKNSKSTNFIPELLIFLISANVIILRLATSDDELQKDHFFYLRTKEDIAVLTILCVVQIVTRVQALIALRHARVYLKSFNLKLFETIVHSAYTVILIVISFVLDLNWVSETNLTISILTSFFVVDMFVEKLSGLIQVRNYDFIRYNSENTVLRHIFCKTGNVNEDTLLSIESLKIPLIMDKYDFDDETEVICFLNIYINSLSFALKQCFNSIGDEIPAPVSDSSKSQAEDNYPKRNIIGHKRWFGTINSGEFTEKPSIFFTNKPETSRISIQAVKLDLIEQIDLELLAECGEDMEDRWTDSLEENKGIFSYLSDESLKTKRNLSFRSKNKRFVVEISALTLLQGTFLDRYVERTKQFSFLPRIVGIFKVQFMGNETHAVIVTENIVNEELINKNMTLWQQAAVSIHSVEVTATSTPCDNLLDTSKVVVGEGFSAQILSHNRFREILRKDLEFLRSARCSNIVFSFLYCEFGSIKVWKGDNTTFMGESEGERKSLGLSSFNQSRNISAIHEDMTEMNISSETFNEIVEGNGKNFEGINNDLKCILSFGFDNVFGDRFLLDRASFYRDLEERILEMFKETSFSESN